MRAGYELAGSLQDVMRLAGKLPARTMIFDVEPLVAYWDSGPAELDQGIAHVLGELDELPGLQVVCFATNSPRRPSVLPNPVFPNPVLPDQAQVRVMYLPSAGKPLRTTPYLSLPRPGVVIGDQVVTDGILARRLGFAFVLYVPQTGTVPLRPRLLGACGQALRPLLFRRAG